MTGTRVTVTRTQLMNIHTVLFLLHYSHQRKNSQNTPAFNIHKLAFFFFFFWKPAPANTFRYTSKCGKAKKKKKDGHGERQTDRQWGQFPFLLLATRTRSCQRCESDNGEGNAAHWGDLDSKHTLSHNS